MIHHCFTKCLNSNRNLPESVEMSSVAEDIVDILVENKCFLNLLTTIFLQIILFRATSKTSYIIWVMTDSQSQNKKALFALLLLIHSISATILKTLAYATINLTTAERQNIHIRSLDVFWKPFWQMSWETSSNKHAEDKAATNKWMGTFCQKVTSEQTVLVSHKALMP